MAWPEEKLNEENYQCGLDTEWTEGAGMKEYIEKAVALEALSKSGVTCNLRAHKIVASIQAADVVEAVRCKDCRYWQDNNGGYPHPECRWRDDETPNADDYCSFGERKEAAHEVS